MSFKCRLVASANFKLVSGSYTDNCTNGFMHGGWSRYCTYNGYDYALRQADVSVALLQSPIDDNVYIERPPSEGNNSAKFRKKVWKFNKAIFDVSWTFDDVLFKKNVRLWQ